jgi:hypothetical protein
MIQEMDDHKKIRLEKFCCLDASSVKTPDKWHSTVLLFLILATFQFCMGQLTKYLYRAYDFWSNFYLFL